MAEVVTEVGCEADEPASKWTGKMSVRQLVVVLVIALVLGFFAQEVVSARYSEPYPGFALPSFAPEILPNVITRRVAVVEVEFSDGRVVKITDRQFFGLGRPRPQDLLKAMFWKSVRRVGPGQFVPDDDLTPSFVRERLAALFPLNVDEIDGFTVTWILTAVNRDGTENDKETKVLRTVHVDL